MLAHLGGFKMRYLTFLLFVIGLLFFQGCESGTESQNASYTKGNINTSLYEFPKGKYYRLKTVSYDHITDPEEELRKFINKNIIIEKAWYRGPSNGCRKPGSNSTTATMYPECFLVLVRGSDIIEDENYKPAINAYVPCGYNVVYYKYND